MAHLRAYPKTFTQAQETFNKLSRGKDSVKLGNNTFLEPVENGFAIRLHATNIVVFHADGRVTLHTGGWHTVTTKDRLNEFISGRVYQKNHDWFLVGHKADGSLNWENPTEFFDGIVAN